MERTLLLCALVVHWCANCPISLVLLLDVHLPNSLSLSPAHSLTHCKLIYIQHFAMPTGSGGGGGGGSSNLVNGTQTRH